MEVRKREGRRGVVATSLVPKTTVSEMTPVRCPETTPLTQAMAEGHVWIEDGLIYVYHTIRWADKVA